mmetsp:Transcript_4738/g.11275  ORF Transcript_4738/g.11275 Transcript_4738/m.11275 type:complete len:316 (+) Transcript_4738:159-1106(+)
MAHGLRTIANKSYNAYGTGRDWFFLGDAEYRDGKRTPLPNQGGMRPQPPPARPRALIPEVSFEKRQRVSKEQVLERWHRAHSEIPANMPLAATQAEATSPRDHELSTKSRAARRRAGLMQRPGDEGQMTTGGNKKEKTNFATTYRELGLDSRFVPDRSLPPAPPEIARAQQLVQPVVAVSRSASEPAIKELQGDHPYRVQPGDRPHYTSTYMSHGWWYDPEARKDRPIPPPRASAGLPAALQDPNEINKVLPAKAPKVKVEGYADYSSGHKGPTPHFFTTYQQLGRYQPVDYQRYDFGAVAKNYRFTRWQSMRES